MRNVQRTASRTVEWGGDCAPEISRAREDGASGAANSSCRTGAIMAMSCWVACTLAVDWRGISCRITHDFIVAQQLQLDAVVSDIISPHCCEGVPNETEESATIRKTATTNRFVIDPRIPHASYTVERDATA